MKRFMTAFSIAAILGLGSAVYAGPANGSTHYRGGTFLTKSQARQVDQPYALTGSAREHTDYKWRRKVRWIGGHKYRRVLWVREAVH